MNNRGNDTPFASRRELVTCITLACLNIVLYGIISHLTVLEPAFVAFLVVFLYLMEIAIVGVFHKRTRENLDVKTIYDLLGEEGSVVFKNTEQPVSAYDKDGTLLWCNEAMLRILRTDDNPVGKNINELLGSSLNSDTIGQSQMELKGRIYTSESFVIGPKSDSRIYILMLNDITEISDAQKKYNDSRVCIAYIAIDNVEDMLQYIHEKFRDSVSMVDEKLKKWASSMNASIHSYDNEKYIMFFDSKSLEECVANRFAILDEIRETRVSDGMSITVSMGISRFDGTLRQRELAARDAIDLALQRGGDAVVFNDDGVTTFFGGRSKSVYKRSNVKSRTFANQLTALMGKSDNVIIMGHRFGDFDSFGASLGVAKIALATGVKVNIAVDIRDKNLAPCIALMQQTEEYAQMFVDNAGALDLVGPDTLVILVDHNNLAIAQFPDLTSKVRNIAVIDHHRKNDEALADNVKLYYIEPSASSACELVTEMLESVLNSQNLVKEAADMLLAGILLDTKQFTRNTGTRTFGAAQSLRGAGANPTDVYGLFKTAPDDLRKEARFHTGITIYRGNIAISCCDGDTDDTYRIIASKAADKMLTLQGIDASFTLVRIGEMIHISGRSNGKISVQLILEKLNGGGHFDMAGAQVVGKTVMSVLETLKGSIDDYLDLM